MKKRTIKVGNWISLTRNIDPGYSSILKKHFQNGTDYLVEWVGEYFGTVVFKTFTGRCRSSDCYCNNRGWYFTDEFFIQKKPKKSELMKARALPSATEVANYFGVTLK